MFYKILLKAEESLCRIFPTIDDNKPYFLCDLFGQWSIYYFEDSYFSIEKGADPFVTSYQSYSTIYDAGFALLECRAREMGDDCFVEEYGYQFFKSEIGIKAINKVEQEDFISEIISTEIKEVYQQVLKQHSEKMQAYIHLGFTKCASTYLQDTVFTNLSNGCYLRKDKFFACFPYIMEEAESLWQQRNQEGIKKYEASLNHRPIEPLLEEYRKKLRSIYLQTDFRIFVFSAEEFSSVMAAHFSFRFFECLMPSAKFLFVVRNQLSRMESIHLQGVKMGRCFTYHDFLKRYRRYNCTYSANIIPCLEKFSRSKVVVWLFEEVVTNIDALLGSIGLIANIKESKKVARDANIGLSSALYSIVLTYNRITKRQGKMVNVFHQTKTLAWLY